MAYRNLTNMVISLRTVGVTQQGFGVPLFASSHRYFPERVRAYTSLTSAAEDLPTNSAAYRAVQGYFSVTPAPSIVKIGRREADLDLVVATGSTAASMVIKATDGTNTYTLAVDVSGVDEDAVATAIQTAIEGDGSISPLVTTTVSNDTVTITPASASDDFWVSDLSSNLTEEYSTIETATELMAELTSEDDDFYFVSADDHTETFVLAMAADVEARTKMYFTSVQEVGALTAYIEGGATDVAGKLADSGYNRTKVFFAHDADTTFPETTHIASNAVHDAGSVLWANKVLPITFTKDPSTNKKLSATQKGYLEDRNVSYIDPIGGQNVLRNNRVAGGEWISNIRGRDNMKVDIDTAFLNLMLSQDGTKIPYTSGGIARLEQTLRNVLERYVLRGFISSNYITTFLQPEQMSISDRQAGIYNGGSFRAELQGGILFVDISGSLEISLG